MQYLKGYYLTGQAKSVFVRLGTQKKGLENIPAHGSTFDFDEDALGVGAAILAETANLAIDSLSKKSAGPSSSD